MTWEISLLKLSKDIATFEELTDTDLLPLGQRSEILTVISSICPSLVFPAYPNSPDLAKVANEEYHIEFCIPDNESILMVGVDVYVGDEDAILAIISNICQTTGWRAFDAAQGIPLTAFSSE